MRPSLLAVLLVVTSALAAHAVTIQTPLLRLEIDDSARLVSLTVTETEIELGAPGEPVAYAVVEGDTVPASALVPTDAGYTLTFGETGVTATVSWEEQEGLALISLGAVTGEPQAVDFFTLRLAEGEQFAYGHALRTAVGPELAFVSETQDCRIFTDGSPRLHARVEAEVSLGPARIAFMAAPAGGIGDRIARAEELFGIPLGIKAKRSDAARGAYLMIGGVSADNADRVIAWARRGGFGSILLLHGTWGHFGRRYAVPENLWPGGVEQLRATVERAHDAGLLVGAHMFSSKVPKRSVWTETGRVRDFYEDRSLTLAEPLSADADRIVTTAAPTEWPVTTGARDLRIDDELLTYTSLSLEPPFGFTGVSRAAYGTTATEHAAGAEVAHVQTDESRGIFIINQRSDLLDIHAQDIANTYNAADFDWIYFDGAEDVHEPRWWTISNAQMAVIEKLEREPAIVQMAAASPFSWHLTTRTGQRDYFWVSMSYKDEIDDAVERGRPRAQNEMAVADLGWFPLRPTAEHVRATQVDDVEYLCARALATDSAYSILTDVERMEDVPCLDAILHLMARWEHHKFAGAFGADVKQRLCAPRQDFMLLESAGQEPRIVAAREMPYVGGTSHLVRAMVGERVDGVITVALAPVDLPATISFSLDPRRLVFTDYKGDPHEVTVEPGARVTVPVTTRVFMRCDGISAGEIRMALRGARCEVIKPPMVFLDAGRPARLEGGLTTAEAAGVTFDGALAGALAPAVPMNAETGPQHFAEYELDLPVGGRWYLWIRARYADTNSNSFYLYDPDHPDRPITLGNRIGVYEQWLWDGPVRLELPAGRTVLRITGRESRPLQSPVLDVIALVYGGGRYRPTDADARAALSGGQ